MVVSWRMVAESPRPFHVSSARQGTVSTVSTLHYVSAAPSLRRIRVRSVIQVPHKIAAINQSTNQPSDSFLPDLLISLLPSLRPLPLNRARHQRFHTSSPPPSHAHLTGHKFRFSPHHPPTLKLSRQANERTCASVSRYLMQGTSGPRG